MQKNLLAEEVNYVSQDKLKPGSAVVCKIRYSDKGSQAEIISADENHFELRFNGQKSAITPGQSAVIYDEQGYVLAGGIIKKGF